MSIKNIYYLLTSSRAFCIHIVFTISAIYYVSQAGLNALQLVLIGTIMELAVLLFEIPTGLVADFWGRKRSFIIGTFLIGAAHILEASFPTFWVIAAGAALWGIGWTFISGAETAWIADELENKELDQVFLRGAKFSSIASFLGIVVGILLALLVGVQTTIFLAGALLVIFAFISLRLVPETKFVSVKRESTSGINQIKFTLTNGFRQIKGTPVLVYLAIITVFMGLASEGFDRLWEAHFMLGFHLNETDAIYWFGAFAAITYILNIFLLNLIDKYQIKNYSIILLTLNSLLIVVMILFAVSNVLIVSAILYCLIASLRTVNYPLINILTNKQLESKGRATTLSLYGQLDAFGQIAGGPIVGFIALYTSIQGGLIVSALLIAPTLYFLWVGRKYMTLE